MPKGVHNGHLRGADHPVTKNWQPPCSPETLRSLYADRGMTKAECAAELGVGVKRVETALIKFGIPRRKAAKRDQRGEKNTNWKPNGVTYAGQHYRVVAARGTPSECARCGSKDEPGVTYEWANLTGRYDDVNDFERMCRSCHRRYDNARRREVIACA